MAKSVVCHYETQADAQFFYINHRNYYIKLKTSKLIIITHNIIEMS